MPALNSVSLIGNLTRDPETKFLPSGTAVTDIGLAINEHYKNASGEKVESTLFVDVTFFGRIAEIAAEYLKKGSPVYVSGRLKLDVWDDKTTGQKRSKMRVVGEALQLLGGKDNGTADRPF